MIALLVPLCVVMELLFVVVPGVKAEQSSASQDTAQYTKPELSPISGEVTEFYQRNNAALVGTILDAHMFKGAHDGPGIVNELDGPIFQIIWLRENKDPKGATTDEDLGAIRYVPFSSIVTIDRPFMSSSQFDGLILYYTGPSGRIEFAILHKGDFAEKFVKRWRVYLLGKER